MAQHIILQKAPALHLPRGAAPLIKPVADPNVDKRLVEVGKPAPGLHHPQPQVIVLQQRQRLISAALQQGLPPDAHRHVIDGIAPPGKAEDLLMRGGKTADLLSFMGIGNEILFMGEKMPLRHSSDHSEGALKIVREASSDSIFVLAFGPLTDIAAAIEEDESIVKNLTVIWTGGAKYPDGGWEYNLFNDIEAANYVIASGVKLIMIPKDVYQCLNVSFSELYLNLRGYKLGQYLFSQLMEHSMEDGPRNALIRSGDGWILGDNAVLSPLLCPRSTEIAVISAPYFTGDGVYNLTNGHGTIEIVRKIDARYLLCDMFSKFRIFGESCEDRGI